MMTNERAIELLHRISDSQFDGIHGDERREALEMAVRALSGDGDTISRKMAIDTLTELREKTVASESFRLGIYRSIEELKNVPSVQVERKKGKWIHHPEWEEDGDCGYECSECHMGSDVDYNFCMRCGADMRGEDDDS